MSNIYNKMYTKTVSKDKIRRTVYGTCVMLAVDGGASGGARPRKVTITLLRRRGCWRALSSRRVGVFAFPEACGPTSVPAPLDLEYLFRCSGKADAAAMQIKICVAYYCRGAPRKARVSLDEFMEPLLDGGRPGSFYLYIYDDKVGLQQASQQFQALPTAWPLEQKPGKGKKAVYDEELTDNDHTYSEWKTYLEKVFSMDDDEESTDNNDDTYSEWKTYLEKVFSVENDEANADNDDDTHTERKVPTDKVFAVEYNELDEAVHEVVEASDMDGTDAHESVHELEQASGGTAAKETPELHPELEQASGGTAAEEDAPELHPELGEASGGTAAEEEAPELHPELGEASGGTAAEEEAPELHPELEQASGGTAAEEEAPELGETSGGTAAEEEATELHPELREASGGTAAEEEAPELGEGSRSGNSATDRAVSRQGEAPSPVHISAAATAFYAYRSLTVPQRFIAHLAGPSDRQLEDLQRSHGVSIVRVRRTLHIKGHRDAVLQCHSHVRDEIAEWRRREVAEAQ
ncbi:uncharacterized protein LOC126998680 isoform X2 [Eriocheir sinensis]|uniref:uncharacterized protein LOC126998680 isoform X2 n=1 Tax=Eriocheir sinensis TaxID=95602 RepID=UPI0021C753EB|nr:uncharacterized protein LOC126998680 isoform X2 [Eriocheir sinensis]